MGTVVFALAVFGVLGGALAEDATAARLLPPACRVYEHYERNTNRCQLTCRNMKSENIMGACLPTSACYCNTGYVRNSDGLCIKREKCPPPQTCGRNEHYEKHSKKCQLTCDNVSQEHIMPPCSPTSACFCNDGYVRTREGVCVKKNYCRLPICGPNEHYEKDTHRCTISCDNMHLEPIMGPCSASSGCFCDKGYVRNKHNYCIKRSDCPPRCNPNERYLNHTVQCQITCQNMAQEPYMGACVPSSGCFCIPGYVKNHHGVCIRKEDCPRPCVCGLNEVSTNCYNDCQRTCKNRIIGDGKVCTLACTQTGCVCKPGHLRHDNGTCVPEDQCSTPDCYQGEVYDNCGPSCPKTCDNRGDTCTMCTAQCVPGCYCAKGTIKAPNGKCVHPKKCPPRTCTGCNEEFDGCPPTCPPTEDCSNIWSRFDCSKPVDCCKPSCRCKTGFYRNSKKECISTQACINGNGARASARAESGYAEANAEAGSSTADAEAGSSTAEATAET